METRIPKKIDDESLKDAVVEFRYVADLPPHLLWGILFQSLPEGFALTPETKSPMLLSFGKDAPIGIKSHANTYVHNSIRLHITENALIFNIIGPYAGWTPYFEVIQKTIRALTGPGKIIACSRVGLRYISEFPNLKIFEKIGAKCKLERPGWEGQRNTVFKTEIWSQENIIVINLANQVVRNPAQPDHFFSLVDIDVFHNFDTPEQNTENLLRRTDELHALEKTTFFGLLTDEFLTSLNPQY